MCAVFSLFVNRKLFLHVFVLLGLHAGNWYSSKETTQVNTLF